MSSSDSLEHKELFNYSKSLLMLQSNLKRDLTIQSNFNREVFASISKDIITKAAEGSFPVESIVSFLSLFAQVEFQCLAILLCKYIKKIPDRILEHDYLKPFLAVKFPEQFKNNEDYKSIVKHLDLASDSLQFFKSPKRFSLAFGDDFSLGQKFPITEDTVLKEEEALSTNNIDGIQWLKIEGSQTYLGARAFAEIFKLVLKYKDKFSGFVKTDSKVLDGLNGLTTELHWVAAVDYIMSSHKLNPLVDMLLSLAIDTLPLGKKVLLPYGYSNHDGAGHSMLCEFEGLSEDKVRFYIFNTGDGINNHISAAIGGRVRYLPYHIFDEVPRKTLMESAFFNSLSLLQTPSKRESKYSIGGAFIYQDLLLQFENYLIKDLNSIRKTTGKTKLEIITDQKSGTCSFMVFRMRARFQFGEDFRKVMTFMNTFVQSLIIQNNLQHAKSSIFWKRALLARTESASRALYKWIRRGEERFTFNGINMEEFKKFMIENIHSRTMNEIENEIYQNLRRMLEELNLAQPPILPIPKKIFEKWDGSLSRKKDEIGNSNTPMKDFNLSSLGTSMRHCKSLECYAKFFSEAIDLIYKMYLANTHLEYCLLTIRRTFLLLPDVDSLIWNESGQFAFLEDMYRGLFMMSKIVQKFRIFEEGVKFLDFFIRFKASFISLKVFQTLYPDLPKFKFDCRPLDFFKHWYLFRSFDADLANKYAKLHAACISNEYNAIFLENDFTPVATTFEYHIIERLSSKAEITIDKWIKDESLVKENPTKFDLFFSKALNSEICKENKELEPLRALKILLVLSSYCMKYDEFQEDFVKYSTGFSKF